MNEQEKKVLLDIKKQVEDNAKILKSLQAKNRWEMVRKIVYYIIIIGISLYTWYQIEPYYKAMFEMIDKVGNGVDKVDKIMDNMDKVSEFLN